MPHLRRGQSRPVDPGRSSGVFLHPTSLPGGRLGPEAYAFVDWLAAAGQSWWQMLPLGPPDSHGSPYTSASAFAAWPGLLAEPGAPVGVDEIESFVARHPFWAGDWAAFAGDGALAAQVRFEREWSALRAYAAERGVGLIGDVPIYVAAGSADQLAHRELFQSGAVAGAPPDALSKSGQLWGNPLYDWPALRATGYRWWVERFRRTFELFDMVRIDHFRGFVAYWAVPEGHRTARRGRWRRGPGREVFDAVSSELGELSLIAEDLGVITPPVRRLRDELGLPGMVVLQYELEIPERSVVYPSTHDTDTAAGWWRTARREEREQVRAAAAALGVEEREPHRLLAGLALASPARLAIVPVQDLLGLGSAARTNTPGRAAGNWRWRLEPGALDDALAADLRARTAAAGRLAQSASVATATT
jgi:4-alpha-glucanotransferase